MIAKHGWNAALVSILDFTLFIVLPFIFLYSASTLPTTSLIFPVGCSLFILLIGIKRLVFSQKKQDKREIDNIRAIFLLISALILFCLLLDIIGFYIAGFFLACFVSLHFESDRSHKSILYAILTAVILLSLVHLCFSLGLYLVLPEGLLFAK